MARPRGAKNKGLRYVISDRAKSLEMAAKDAEIGVDELSSAAAAYRRLLNKAIKCASPSDAATLQRIGSGLSALTKALSAVERLKKLDGPQGKLTAYPLD